MYVADVYIMPYCFYGFLVRLYFHYVVAIYRICDHRQEYTVDSYLHLR